MDLSSLLYMDNGRATNLIYMLVDFFPKLVLAIVIWVVAWLVAKYVARGILMLLNKSGLDKVADKSGINAFLKNARFKGGLSSIIADIVYWIIYLIGINSAFETVGLTQVSALIADLIAYIPSLFVAVIILLVGAFIAKFVKDVTDGAVATAKMKHSWIGHVVYVIVMLFTIVTALKQAQVDISFFTENVNTIVMGIMLALGLSFGLGGQGKAKEIIEKYMK